MAVIAPAGLPRLDDLRRGLDRLAARYRVLTYRDLSRIEPWGMLAGTDAVRAAELRWAASHPEVSCVIAVRGGYGTARIVEGELLDQLARAPRLAVGFSDLTVLLSGLLGRGLRAIHGPMVCQLGGEGKEVLFEELMPLLESSRPPPSVGALEPLVPGTARGPLVGGNLTMLSHLVGTELMPPLDGAVLMLEDVDERPYRLDRCLVHLRRAGVLEQVQGIVFGELVGCDPRGPELPFQETIAHFCGELGLPAATGLPLGHGRRNLAVPLGAQVILDAGAGRLTFLEGAVA